MVSLELASSNWKVQAGVNAISAPTCCHNLSQTDKSSRLRIMTLSQIRRITALLSLLTLAPASAQDASSAFEKRRPEVGGTIPKPAVPPTFGPRAGADVLRHRDFTGKPCLTVQGSARSHIINPKLYDHVISASNSCPQRITIRVCYYHTNDCIPMEIPGGERKEAILGTLPTIHDFGFEFREKF
jgi:hypothetical protein